MINVLCSLPQYQYDTMDRVVTKLELVLLHTVSYLFSLEPTYSHVIPYMFFITHTIIQISVLTMLSFNENIIRAILFTSVEECDVLAGQDIHQLTLSPSKPGTAIILEIGAGMVYRDPLVIQVLLSIYFHKLLRTSFC